MLIDLVISSPSFSVNTTEEFFVPMEAEAPTVQAVIEAIVVFYAVEEWWPSDADAAGFELFVVGSGAKLNPRASALQLQSKPGEPHRRIELRRKGAAAATPVVSPAEPGVKICSSCQRKKPKEKFSRQNWRRGHRCRACCAKEIALASADRDRYDPDEGVFPWLPRFVTWNIENSYCDEEDDERPQWPEDDEGRYMCAACGDFRCELPEDFFDWQLMITHLFLCDLDVEVSCGNMSGLDWIIQYEVDYDEAQDINHEAYWCAECAEARQRYITSQGYERSCEGWPLWHGYVTYELASARKHGACRSNSDEGDSTGSQASDGDLW